MRRLLSILLLLILAASQVVNAQTSTFNYQGKLTEAGNPANGGYQMQFKLFDALAAGNQIGSTISDVPVTANQGIFTVKLDFGAPALSGANRWLEMSVRHNSGESYTTLSPREQIVSSPYAVRTLSAQVADNALALGGIPANEYVTTSSAGNSFIRNGTALQTGNFNINGNGLFGGSIGLGTSNLISPLTIQNTSFTYGWTQTNGTVSVSSYVDPTGGWLGTRSNHPLYFFTNGGLQQMALLQNGNFGIGILNPTARLHVAGGAVPGISATSQGNAIVGTSSTAGFAAIYGENTSGGSGFGIYGKGTIGFGVFAEGHAGQSRDKGGFVKAMVFVNGVNGSIGRCYNGMTGVTVPTCGLAAERLDVGVYRLTFPFQISDRFFSVSTLGGGVNPVNDTIMGQVIDFPTATTVRVFVNESSTGGRRDGDFCFIVY